MGDMPVAPGHACSNQSAMASTRMFDKLTHNGTQQVKGGCCADSHILKLPRPKKKKKDKDDE